MMAELSTTSLTPTEYDLDHEAENNETGCQLYDEPSVTIYSVILFICLFGVVGNGIVLWFLGFHIKRNPFTVYILNLAITDTCFLLCSVTFIIIHMVKHPLCMDETFIFIFLPPFLLAVLMYNNSLYLLTAISTERCVSVLYPIWYRCRRPRHLSAIMCALLWALSILLTGLVAFFCFNFRNETCGISLLTMCGLSVLIFTPIMVLSNLTLSIKVRCSSQRRQPGKLYIVILLNVLFFLLFAVPMSVETLLDFHNTDVSSEICHFLASANSSINPFIYFLVGSYRKRRFRGSVKGALQRIFEEKAEPREDEETPRANPVDTAT